MEQFREENARDKLFDADMAYQLIDSLRSQEVSAYEIQGFLQYQTSDVVFKDMNSMSKFANRL
jgi:hypothetical protein